MRWDKAVSMRLMKREGRRKVTPALLLLSAGRRSGQRERASGLASSLPGTWIILRSKSVRSINLLRFFSFHTSFVSRLSSVSSHRSPERPPPKRSFLFIRCAWFPCPVSTFLLWMYISYTRLPQRRLFSSIALPKHSSYIHLSSYSMNTAWSVRRLSTYLNDDISCTISLT